MGLCGSKVSPAGGGKVSPRKSPRRSETASSAMRQAMVQVESKHDITESFDLEGGDVLGSGATSTVRTCTHKQTGKKYALKTIRLNRMSKNKRNMLLQEVELMKQMDHPYIVKIVATFLSFQTLHIVMECCTGGGTFCVLFLFRRGRVLRLDHLPYHPPPTNPTFHSKHCEQNSSTNSTTNRVLNSLSLIAPRS